MQALGFREEKALWRRYADLLGRGRPTEMLAAFRLKTLYGHKNTINAVAITRDGLRAVSGGDDGMLKQWDLETGQCLNTLTLPGDKIKALAITADGRQVVSASVDRVLRFWDFASGQCAHALEGHTKVISTVAVTGDGRWAMSGGLDHRLRLWDLRAGKCLHTLVGHAGDVRFVTITEDGREAISLSEDGAIKWWDLVSGQCVRTMVFSNYPGSRGLFALDGVTADRRQAILTGMDRTLKLWDLASEQCVRSVEGMERVGAGAIALAADEHYALTAGGSSHGLRLWELASGRCLSTLTGHTDRVTAVAAVPDWSSAVSGGQDAMLAVWRFIWALEFPGEGPLDASGQEQPNEDRRATVSLQKGQRLSLSKEVPNLKQLFLGLGWDLAIADDVECDVDASAFLLGANGKVRSDVDVVYYGQSRSGCHSVQILDADHANLGDSDQQALRVDLDRVPAEVRKIAFTLTIHEAEQRRQNFGQVNNAYLRLVDAETNQDIARYDLGEDATTETALIFGELYRHGEEWRFNAVGQGYADGLAALCRRYGVNL